MSNIIYKKVERFITDAFAKTGDELGVKHSLRTVYWIKVLKPDADEALLIAAAAHDIEKAFRKGEYNKIKDSDKGFRSDEHLDYHQKESAKIISDFLEKNGADEMMIERVKMLVSKHEIGGDADQNLLKDVDSISFFENNVEHFANKQVNEAGKEKVKDKFNCMYNRITSEKAKQIVRQWYEEAIKRLA